MYNIKILLYNGKQLGPIIIEHYFHLKKHKTYILC